VKYKFSKFASTAVIQQQIMRPRIKENATMADELLLIKEDKTNSSFSMASSTVCCYMVIFSLQRWLEETPTRRAD